MPVNECTHLLLASPSPSPHILHRLHFQASMSSKQQGLAARLWLGRDAEPPIEQPSSGSQGTAAKRGKEKARQKAGALRERAAAAVAHPAGRAALIGAGVWLAARGTVEVRRATACAQPLVLCVASVPAQCKSG